MTAPPPPRPWWKKRRWWAAGLLWLAVAYPASLGPYGYLRAYHGGGRYNLPRVYSLLLPPGLYFHERSDPVRNLLCRYYHRCFDVGVRHCPLGPLP